MRNNVLIIRCSLCLLLIAFTGGNAQQSLDNLKFAESITIGEKVTIQSEVLGEERSILVSLPDNYNQNEERYPVLYLTDAESHFLLMRGVVNFLVSLNWMQDVIIVGINNTDRFRDLTPTHLPVYIESDGSKEEFPTSEGADKFIQFLEKELFPATENHYRTFQCRFFMGHSLGGLFGIHMIAARPGLFSATVAIGPSLWWDKRVVSFELKSVFEKTKTLNHALFFSLAVEDNFEEDPKPSVQLRSFLNTNIPEGFKWHFEDLTDETHDSAVLRGLYYGLKFVFNDWRLPIDPDEERYIGDLAGLKAHYSQVFNGVGFKAPEGQVNVVAYQRLNRNLFDQALEFFRYNIELYPESAKAYDSLGEALEKSGQLREALASCQKAIELGKKYRSHHLGSFRIHLERITKALKRKKIRDDEKRAFLPILYIP